MKAVYKCSKCYYKYEDFIDRDNGNLTHIRRCPQCGLSGVASLMAAYPDGTLRIKEEFIWIGR